MQKPKAGKKPFFARFLETQDLKKINSGATLKYPSDRDEDIGGLGGVGAPAADTTQKFPSDNDEGDV